MFPVLWQALGGPPLIPEYRFSDRHRYRFDYALPAIKVAIEIEGGVRVGIGHAHFRRYESDCRKYNLAQRLGWIVFRFTPQMLREDIDELTAVLSFVLERWTNNISSSTT